MQVNQDIDDGNIEEYGELLFNMTGEERKQVAIDKVKNRFVVVGILVF